MPVVEGSMVFVKDVRNPELGDLVSKAMQQAILDCVAEGMMAPQVQKERMMAAREAVIKAWDEAHRPPAEG